MVLLLGDQEVDTLRILTADSEIRMFFFSFEHVALRNKDDNEKQLELLAHLEKQPFKFFSPRVTGEGKIGIKKSLSLR